MRDTLLRSRSRWPMGRTRGRQEKIVTKKKNKEKNFNYSKVPGYLVIYRNERYVLTC